MITYEFSLIFALSSAEKTLTCMSKVYTKLGAATQQLVLAEKG